MNSVFSIRNCKFAFKCDATWDSLKETSDVDIKYCHGCEKEVHFCNDDEDLVLNVRLNRCVAFDRLNHNNDDTFMGLVVPYND